MALVQSGRPPGSGGGGETLRWQRDRIVVTEAFAAGDLTLSPTQIPIDEASLLVFFQLALLDTSDYDFNTSSSDVTILFGADPAVDYPETGEVIFILYYPYAV